MRRNEPAVTGRMGMSSSLPERSARDRMRATLPHYRTTPTRRERTTDSPSGNPCDEDFELIRQIVRGDNAAFARLIRKHQARTFAVVRGIIGDWHLSEDVCQEVFTTVYRKVGSFRRDARFSTWLYRLTVNAALKARGRRRRNPEQRLEDIAQLFQGKEDTAPAFEGEEVIERLLRPLPEPLRVAVLLHEAAGLNYVEIASVLDCTRGAVEQRLHRAMVQLRLVWQDDLSAETDSAIEGTKR